MNGIVATAEIEIDASPAEVWRALTDPAHIEQWMLGSKVETDWQVGSPIVWKGEHEGKTYEDKGEVLQHDEPSTLSMTHFSPLSGQDDVPANYHRLVYELAEHDGHTHVTLRQDGNGSEEEAEHSRGMWEQMLGALKDHVESASGGA
jgi:uncharacterized protein YndB with AHSA1/START domain